MFVDSYQTEVQNLATGEWKVDQYFRLRYKWRRIVHRVLGLLRRVRQEIVGDPQIQALIIKSDAYRHACHTMRVKRPRPVRITCIKREGARLVKFVIWQNGKWLE